ncbi:MAG: glycosyltransferase family 4 protein [Chloroflexi bacterium]|nr:glycosyltransferase family 4 protein [Chloroflexota bacterium]
MRVLFITGEFPPMQGGVGDCTNEIAKGLVACGVDVRVLTSINAKLLMPNAKFQILPSVVNWGWSCWRNIWNAYDAFTPDVIHIQYQTGAFGMHPAINFAPRYLKLPNTKFVTTFHDLRVPYLFPKAGPVRNWVTRVLAKSCDAVIATNDEDYVKLGRWHAKHLELIPIGSNITTTPPIDYDRNKWRIKLGVAENETLLCYFGFLNESKGGETLIRALAQIPNAKLLMIGGQVGASDPTNAAYLTHVKSLISDLQLTDRVLWTDFALPDVVSAHFYASDICVLPYRDGASYRRGTLMAALAHGMAIVTTVISGQSTVNSQQSTVNSNPSSVFRTRLPKLENEINCLMIPPDNPQAIADAVQRLNASPELRAKIAAGARELAQYFTWDKIAQQHFELYNELVP